MSFNGFLRQSTAVDVLIGPFVDEDDGKTAEAGLTIAQADVQLSKNGQTLAQKSDNTTCAADGSNGFYNCELDATDTNTVGQLAVTIFKSGALPVRHEYHVVEEAVYDNMYAGSAAGPALASDVTTAHATTDALLDSEVADILVDTGTTIPGLIAALNDPAASAIADAVWDEVLTGAAHNIASSAGRRLRAIQDYSDYSGGAVFIDTVNGVAGTVDFENGTTSNPVDSIADATTIASSVGLTRFYLHPGSSITLGQAYDNWEFDGENWTLALGGQSISNSRVHGAVVSGVATGANPPLFENCEIGVCTLPPCTMESCGFTDASSTGVTFGSAGSFFFHLCYSQVAGNNAPIFTWDGGGTSRGNFRAYSGGVQFESMVAGETCSIEGMGQFIEGTCSGGAVTIRGLLSTSGVTNITLTETARYDDTQVAEAIWDVAKSSHTTVGSFGEEVQLHALTTDVTTAHSTTDGKIDTIDGIVDAILVDTGTTLPATLGTPADTDLATDLANIETSIAAVPTATEIWQLASAIDGKTPQQALRYIAAGVAGKVSGAGTGTEVFVGLDASTDRMSVTVDDDGNRSAVSYDP
jgi:hypothetical protein